MTAEPTTTVELPCAACVHAEVCGIRPDVAQWRIELPTTHSAITARAVVTLDCRHFLPLQVLPAPETMATKVFALTPAGVRVVEELERVLGPVVATDEVATEKPVKRPLRDVEDLEEVVAQRHAQLTQAAPKAAPAAAPKRTRGGGSRKGHISPEGLERMREAAIRGGNVHGSPIYDRQATFAAVRRHAQFKDAAAELGIKPHVLNSRLSWLAGRGELPDDIASRRRRDAGANRPTPSVSPEARERMLAGAANAGQVAAAHRKAAQAAPAPAHSPVEAPAAPAATRRVVELPDREWPAPLPATVAAAVPDDFAERRAQAARDKAAAVWAERHPEGVAG